MKRVKADASEKDLIRMSEQKRIKIIIPVKSIGLKRFVEKAIRNDEFFSFALENPFAAMKECGVSLDLVVPTDFASFFGALVGVKEMVKKNNIKDLTFEGIFGQAADIRGTYLMAETTKGFYKDWNINALVEKGILSTIDKNFDVSGATEVQESLAVELKREIHGVPLDVQRLGIYFADQSSEKSSGSDKEWSNKDAMRDTRSTNGWNKNFDKAGWGDVFVGPLINPADLAALAARIKAFTEIVDEVGR